MLEKVSELRQFYAVIRQSSAYRIKIFQKIDLVKMLLAEYRVAGYKTNQIVGLSLCQILI